MKKFVIKNDAGTWDITNIGALTIAKDLKKFDNLRLVMECRSSGLSYSQD